MSKREYHMNQYIHPLLALMALLAIGCSHTINIPKPNLGSSTPPPPPEESTIEIPVSVNLQSVFAQAERVVPKEQRASNDWSVVGSSPVGDVGIKYEIWRSPLQLAATGDRLDVSGKIYYWFQFAQKITKPIVGGFFWQELGSCGRGEPPREAMIGIETRVAWSDDWRLTSSTTVKPLSFPNRCKVTFVGIDVTGRVEDAFRTGLREVPALVDGKLREMANFRSTGERAWSQLQTPIALDSGIWLMVEPQAAYVAPLNGSGQSVSTAIGITARPHIVFGDRPSPSKRSLPKLQVKPTGGGIHIAVEGELPYDEANRRLAKELMAEPYSVAGHEVKVTGVDLYGVGDTLVLQAKLAGDINGTIYFIGELAYDGKQDLLYVRNLDYSLETKYTLANVAEWLNHEGFRQRIAEKARWPLGEKLADARTQLERALNRSLGNNVSISTKVNAIRPSVVYSTATSFRARLTLDGSVRVEVK
jgi:hypothetical protein